MRSKPTAPIRRNMPGQRLRVRTVHRVFRVSRERMERPLICTLPMQQVQMERQAFLLLNQPVRRTSVCIRTIQRQILPTHLNTSGQRFKDRRARRDCRESRDHRGSEVLLEKMDRTELQHIFILSILQFRIRRLQAR